MSEEHKIETSDLALLRLTDDIGEAVDWIVEAFEADRAEAQLAQVAPRTAEAREAQSERDAQQDTGGE